MQQRRDNTAAPGGAPTADRPERTERTFDRGERPERSFDRGERPERSFDRGERPERSFDRGERGPRPGGRGRDFRSRRKVCIFCVEHVREIDYKDASRLRRFLSDRGKIEPRRKTGTCAKHQRRLSTALKNARYMAMLPYTAAHIRGS